MFAEDYPRFMEVSELTPKPHRLNERYEALFASNRGIYHTYRHTQLMYPLHKLAPHLIVDTMVAPGTQPTLRVFRERNSEDIRSAAQDAYSAGRVLVARPTVPALRMLLAAYGFGPITPGARA